MSLEGIAPPCGQNCSAEFFTCEEDLLTKGDQDGGKMSPQSVGQCVATKEGGCRSELGQFHQFLLEVCPATCCSHSHSVMCNHLTTSSPDCTLQSLM